MADNRQGQVKYRAKFKKGTNQLYFAPYYYLKTSESTHTPYELEAEFTSLHNEIKRISKCHVEALRIPVNPEQYGFVDVGMYKRGYHEPVFVPTTYSTERQTHYIAASDFSALILTPNVFNPTVVYGCEEFYVDYSWTSAITDNLSLYDFFTSSATDTLRHFVLTINNFCKYAMTLKIWGGHHKPDIDIYSNIRAMTHTLEVACAANRVTRIDVRLRYLEVNTSGSKSVVVTVT